MNASQKQIDRLRMWGYPYGADSLTTTEARDAIFAARQYLSGQATEEAQEILSDYHYDLGDYPHGLVEDVLGEFWRRYIRRHHLYPATVRHPKSPSPERVAWREICSLPQPERTVAKIAHRRRYGDAADVARWVLQYMRQSGQSVDLSLLTHEERQYVEQCLQQDTSRTV